MVIRVVLIFSVYYYLFKILKNEGSFSKDSIIYNDSIVYHDIAIRNQTAKIQRICYFVKSERPYQNDDRRQTVS
jgi:hypothetical protein